LPQYPALAEPYATALRMAVSFVFARFSPCAIVAAGTIVGGSPSPSSDLDVYVLHHARMRQRIQRYFLGVPTEIFVNPPEQVERYFEEEARDGRPITAHMLSTGFVSYSSDDCLARLRGRGAEMIARGPEVSLADLTSRRYFAGCLFEDAVDVAPSDRDASSALLTRAVEDAIRYAFWKAGVWQPRAKDTLRRLEEVAPSAAQHARAFYRESSLEGRLDTATSLFQSLGIPTGFFEWESQPEVLP
jgi:hypothetical protein